MLKIDNQKVLEHVKIWHETRQECNKEIIKSCDELLAIISDLQKNLSPKKDCIADVDSPCDCPKCEAYALEMKKEYDAGNLDPKEDDEECIHWEHEHGICMECGEDIFDSLVGAAEARYEGDR